ncbi:bifunctional adenosylcobinamide kinase/adenosylcobinamide-phosphate guanylyltransferase [Thiospirochaeta perfilievii]|uniref:Adenosylcobinamide kinase n=1 Tax=Thiospirochaeta perfilievii TaxID=252967 RepID=A0A5C1Q762_9SPIO|nr:bifunctional adenosylcobinamide kinase/adenosylcobinamide-phosphate guanylyltransferase [Thiospirochaeta perfilievii]QEN03913.1 bifunctional adenosylcobinamide kinase/adenosylcobinamide-phosphate guanylyltransferase [Thiospirochaeta perfilievii]
MGITLVLGGTKTGKTSFAEKRAHTISKELSLPVYYLATALLIDHEMEDRINRHRESRSRDWITVEEPHNPSAELERLDNCVVILDCLTLLMTNIIFRLGEECPKEEAKKAVFKELDNIISSVINKDISLIIISNQVENGLVSEHKWARMFQDIAGMSHQKLAEACENVYMLNAGLPLKLK